MTPATNQRLTTEIVSAYLRKNPVATTDLPALINSVHASLAGLGQPEQPPEAPKTPAVTVRRSVTPDYVVCIECGWRGKMLKRHLMTSHGLSADAYRKRWGLPLEHPLTAPSYSQTRSAFAKKLGLGRGGRSAEPTPAPGPTSEKPKEPKAARSRSRAATKATSKPRTVKAAPKKPAAKKAAAATKKATAKKTTTKKATARKAAPRRAAARRKTAAPVAAPAPAPEAQAEVAPAPEATSAPEGASA